MKIEFTDAAISAPKRRRIGDRDFFDLGLSEAWHRLWAKVFGRRMPTSGERAHIGKLLLQYRPNTTRVDLEGFDKGWSTDANRIYVIGDLWIFDYGETPVVTMVPQIGSGLHKYYDPDHTALLRENERDYPTGMKEAGP